MSGIKPVCFTFLPLRKTAHSVILSERPEAVLSSGQDLMDVGLMSDIVNDPVCPEIKHEVHGHRQLDDAEI